jgi:hypothetical protein
MQIRTEKILIINSYRDEVAGIFYMRVLTENKCENLRIGKNFEKQSFKHLLQPNYLLQVELIKTVKNWILKEVFSYQVLFTPKTYSDYEKIASIQKILNQLLHEGQETDLLIHLINYFKNIELKDLKVEDFENKVLNILGFGSPQVSAKTAKRDNHL